MVKIIEVKYSRSVVPDNVNPKMHIRKYESEQFGFRAISTDESETVDDLIDACEREVLTQHRRLEEKRCARRDSGELMEELNDINDMLKEIDSNSKCLYDKSKLMARKKEIDKVLDGLGLE